METRTLRYMIILFCVALVLPVSGCTTQPMSSGEGVVIMDFAPESPEYYIGEPATFKVRIENVGSVDAEDVKVTLLNLEGWKEKSSTVCVVPDKLIAPNPDMGTDGGSYVCTFTYDAPDTLPQGLEFQYNPIARLTYTYKSSTVKSITIASQAELRNIQNTGRALPADTVSVSSGPVSIAMISKGPIRYWEDSVTFPVEIGVTNTGGGITATPGNAETQDKRNKVSVLELKLDGKEVTDCLDDQQEVDFWRNTYEKVCNFKLDGLSSIPAPVQKIMEMTVRYDYIIDKQATVELKWR
jgi:hypothetical protein